MAASKDEVPPHELGVHSESPILGQTQIPDIYIFLVYNIYIYIHTHIIYIYIYIISHYICSTIYIPLKRFEKEMVCLKIGFITMFHCMCGYNWGKPPFPDIATSQIRVRHHISGISSPT